ncbi:MAG TPA: L,D-transpeptidase [Actinopolymorphaceae bacterium]
MLASSGVLPVPPGSGAALAAHDSGLTQRGKTAADRSKRPREPRSTPTHETTPDPSTPGPGTTPGVSRTPNISSTPAAGVADPDEPLPANSGSGKRVVYRLGTNHVWLVDESNTVVRSYLVSGTRFGQVRPGSYEVLRMRRNTTSYHGTEKMEYMVTFTEGENAAIGFHNIPVSIETGRPVQSLRQLGTSLSDGCVRQKQSDAKFLWSFVEIGTPVIVLA